MNTAFVIAKNTFRETIRDKILYGILGFSFIYIAITAMLANISLGDPVILKSFGLAGIYIFGSIITIFLGAAIIYKEIERRTLYFVLSKPVSRFDIILGKFLGLYIAILLTTAVMAVVYLCVIVWSGGGFDSLGLLSIFYQALEMGLFVALLIFFSTISTPLTSTIASVMVLFTGHAMSSVEHTAAKIGGLFYHGVQVIYYIFPNLEKFNIRNAVVHGASVSGQSLLLTVIYAAAYAALLLALANILFKRKDL